MINIRQRLSHPFRLLLLLIPIVSLCSYLVMGDFLRWWVLLPALVQIVLLVFAYWHPKVALSTFLVVSVLADALVVDFRMYSLYGIVFAAGLLAYETSNAVAVVRVIALTSVQLIDTLIPGYDLRLRNVPSFTLIYVVAVLIGRGLRWRERRFERDWQAERDRAQAEQMRRNAEIADRIHDAVTGDLALAAVMKQQEMERDDCPNRDLLVQINERVQMALANVHRVIGPA